MSKIPVVLALLSAPVLFAQSGSPFSCNTSVASQPLVRSEGIAELVGDILLTCTGGVSGSAGTANFTVYLNGTITSRIISAGGKSEALLLIDDLSSTPTVGANVIQGVVSGNAVTFFDIPIQPPGSGTRTFRVTNLRVNANAVTGGGEAAAPIVAALSISGNTAVPITNSTMTVGIAAPGNTFTAQDAQGTVITSLAFQNAPQNAALLTDAAAPGGILTHQLKFTEGFNYSFRKRNAATSVATPTAIADQGTPGALNYTETGFYLRSLPSTDGLNVAGLATQGTQLTAQFNNVPSGVALYVTTAPLPNTGATSAALVSIDASGAGSYSAVSPTTNINVGGTLVGIARVTITNGAGTASWEVLDADPNVLESYTFGVVAAYQSSSASNAGVAGTLAPIASVAQFQADATSPVPRFADMSAASLACATTPCLVAVPRGLPLSYQTGTTAPGPFNIQLDTTPTEAMPYQVSVNASQAGWITVSASAGGASGFTPDHLIVTITPGNLPPGVFQASIVISSPTAQFAAVTIPVVLTVTLGPSGYSPLACTPQAAVTPLVRNSGMAERVGDVFLVCAGGVPTASGAPVPAYDMQLTLQTPVTSRLYGSSWSEALLLIDEPGVPANGMPATASQLACNSPTGTCALTGNGTGISYDGSAGHPNVFPGRVSGNTITFPGVPIDAPPAGRYRVLHIVNIRTDVTGVSVSPPDFPAVMANISAGVLAIANPNFAVAYVSTAAAPSLRTPDDSAVSGGSVLDSSTAATPQRVGILRFAGQMGTAFAPRVESNPFPWTNPDAAPSPAAQNSPGTIYATESGFYSPGLTSPLVDFATVGLADSGTRLRAHLSNIPAGATVYVSTRNIAFNNGVPVAPASPVMARLTQAEMQAFAAMTATTTIDGIPAVALPVTAGSATAVWEVLASQPYTLSNVDFMFWVQTAAGTVSSGPVSLTTSFAPASPSFADGDGHTASATLPEPRFSPFSTTYPLVSIFQPAPGAITSPVTGSALTSSSVTFQWTAGTATQYGLWIGSTGVGSANLATPPSGTNTSYTATGLPTNGQTLYVRLWSLVNGSWQFTDYTYTAENIIPAAMTSPANGSTLSASTVTFQWSAGTATEIGLWIGSTGVGSSNLATPPSGTNTSYTATGLPTNGQTLYVRLWSLVNGSWQFNDYTYRAATVAAAITTPVNGSTLTSSSVTFQWTGAATQYGLWIGSTGVGSANLGAPPVTTGTSYTATGLPTDGRTLYVRLWSLVNGSWQYNDYTYTAATIRGAAITTPVNGSTLTSSSVTFQWTAAGATQYGLWVGSAGVGSANLAAPPAGTSTSYTATGLPTDGQTLYVRLWSQINGTWWFNDYTYTAVLGAAVITTPPNGTALTSSSVTFQWTGAATQYGLWIGSTGVGSANLGAPPVTTGTSYTATGLPTDGRTLYIRLWSLVNGSWQFNDYSYTAAIGGAGTVTAPANGTTLASSSVTFQWTGGATQYGLWIGSTGAGSANLAAPPVTSGTTYTVTGLPTDGRALYVRLWSLVNGAWQYNDYAYTAATVTGI